MKQTLPYILFILLLTMVSCEDKKNGGLNGNTYLEEYEKTPTWEELYADTIAEKEHVSKDCGVICNNFDIATDRLKNVLSPQALISAKKIYNLANDNLANNIKGLTADEKTLVQTYKTEADKAYHTACQAYEVPASGVIANLNELIKGIEKVHSKSDMVHYEENRLSILRNLDYIHLCVDQNDRGISDVKRLAQTLKSKYEDKQHELGIK